LFDALQGELTESHRFVLDELMQHIEDIEQPLSVLINACLLDWKTSAISWCYCKPCPVLISSARPCYW
jgi:hypothetical protein